MSVAPQMKIYLAHPISGLGHQQVMDYYAEMIGFLAGLGYKSLYPMMGEDYLRTETTLRANGYPQPASTSHAIVERDLWMVEMSNIVMVDLAEAATVSIGCVMELAWAHLMRKHTIVVMEDDNPHRHAFVLEAADIVFATMSEAKEYLANLQEEQWPR